jgi:hypothetical protein
MSNAKIQTIVENAISKADSSYFFEDYTKQAKAVLKALESAGFTVLPTKLDDEVFLQVSKEMRTGRVKPEEHVKDVFQTALRVIASKS